MNTKFFNALRRSFHCELMDVNNQVAFAGNLECGLVIVDRERDIVGGGRTWVFTHYGLNEHGEYHFYWSTYDLREEQADALLTKRIQESCDDSATA